MSQNEHKYSPTMPSPPNITFLPVTIADLPILSGIQAAAYKSDLVSHLMTLDRPEDWSYTDWLHRTIVPLFQDPAITLLKAVDDATGRTVGWISWAAKDGAAITQKNVENNRESPEPGDSLETPPHEAAQQQETHNALSPAPAPTKLLGRQKLGALIAADSVAQYNIYTSSKCTPHLILQGLFVLPAFQNLGIGTALLTHLTRTADAEKRACWVHASPASHCVYEKAGFREVARLEVDLARFVGPIGKADGKGWGWGEYVFRYMVREGRGGAERGE